MCFGRNLSKPSLLHGNEIIGLSPIHVLPDAYFWDVFTLLPIERKSVHIGWQMACGHPCHLGTQKTPYYTRSMNFKSESGTPVPDLDEDLVIRSLQWWALQGLDRQSEQKLQRLPRHPVSLPSMAELDGQTPMAWPETKQNTCSSARRFLFPLRNNVGKLVFPVDLVVSVFLHLFMHFVFLGVFLVFRDRKKTASSSRVPRDFLATFP